MDAAMFELSCEERTAVRLCLQIALAATAFSLPIGLHHQPEAPVFAFIKTVALEERSIAANGMGTGESHDIAGRR